MYVRADRINLIDLRCVDQDGVYMPGFRCPRPGPDGSRLGDRPRSDHVTGTHAVSRSLAVVDIGRHVKVPQLGHVEIGNDVELREKRWNTRSN